MLFIESSKTYCTTNMKFSTEKFMYFKIRYKNWTYSETVKSYKLQPGLRDYYVGILRNAPRLVWCNISRLVSN